MGADSVLSRFGRYLARLRLEDIPEQTLTAARYQLLDMIAAAFAGARSPETSCVGEALGGCTAGAGRSTVLASGGAPARAAPHDAVVANAAVSMAHDFDDIVWMGHTCHSAVFASLAVAEHERIADPGAFLTAVVAANELGGRLGASCLLGPQNGQMWTFVHLLGAAAATAKLLELDEQRAAHALAIALAQPNFALQPGFLTPRSKLLAAATPAAAGIQAAYFARGGMTGELRIVEDRRGFWSRFSYLPLRPLTEDLDRWWTTQTLTVKTFPGCHYFQTACSAIARIMARTELLPERIARVQIDTTKLGLEATRFAREYVAASEVTPVSVGFDLSLTAAVMIVAGRLTPAELDPGWLSRHADAIRRLRERIEVRHSPELTLRALSNVAAVDAGRAALSSLGARDLLRLSRRYRSEYRSELLTGQDALGWLRALAGRHRHPWRRQRGATSAVPLYFPNRVSVELTGGRGEQERIDLPVGSFCSPAMAAELEAKLMREVGATLGPERAAEVFAAGLTLGDTALDELTRLLRPGA